MPSQHRIIALINDDFEALDLFGPLGAIVPRSDYYTLKLVNVHEFDSSRGLESSIKNGIGILPNLSLAEALREEEHFDTLFIPGGLGMRLLIGESTVLHHLGQLVDRAANVFTVCTGSVLLAATGRLDGRRATTNKRRFDELTPKYPRVKWQKRARFSQDGKFLTSSGVTAGIDAGFAFLSNTYVFPEDRKLSYSLQKASARGDATAIPGYDREKALAFAHSIAFGLEYRWLDATDDPFADLPQSTDV